jgi:hypothetical protein
MGHHQAIGHGGPLLDEYRPGGYELNSGRRSGGGVRNYSPQEEHEQLQAYALPHFQHKHKQQPQQPHRNNQKRPWNRKDVWGTRGGVKFRRINVSNNTSSRENAVQPAPAEHHPKEKRVSKLIMLVLKPTSPSVLPCLG